MVSTKFWYMSNCFMNSNLSASGAASKPSLDVPQPGPLEQSQSQKRLRESSPRWKEHYSKLSQQWTSGYLRIIFIYSILYKFNGLPHDTKINQFCYIFRSISDPTRVQRCLGRCQTTEGKRRLPLHPLVSPSRRGSMAQSSETSTRHWKVRLEYTFS